MTCRDNLTRSARSHLNLIETEYSASEIATSLARPAKPMPCVDAQHSHSIAAGSIAAEVLPAPQGSMAGGSLTAANAPHQWRIQEEKPRSVFNDDASPEGSTQSNLLASLKHTQLTTCQLAATEIRCNPYIQCYGVQKDFQTPEVHS